MTSGLENGAGLFSKEKDKYRISEEKG